MSETQHTVALVGSQPPVTPATQNGYFKLNPQGKEPKVSPAPDGEKKGPSYQAKSTHGAPHPFRGPQPGDQGEKEKKKEEARGRKRQGMREREKERKGGREREKERRSMAKSRPVR